MRFFIFLLISLFSFSIQSSFADAELPGPGTPTITIDSKFVIANVTPPDLNQFLPGLRTGDLEISIYENWGSCTLSLDSSEPPIQGTIEDGVCVFRYGGIECTLEERSGHKLLECFIPDTDISFELWLFDESCMVEFLKENLWLICPSNISRYAFPYF